MYCISPNIRRDTFFKCCILEKRGCLILVPLRINTVVFTVNAVRGEKSLFIVRTIRNIQIHCVGRMQSFSMLKRVVDIVTIHPMALTAHIGPRPPLTRFLNLTLIDNW
jgi:hypothetical protein